MLVQWFENGRFEAPIHPFNYTEELGAIPDFDVTSDFRTYLLSTSKGCSTFRSQVRRLALGFKKMEHSAT